MKVYIIIFWEPTTNELTFERDLRNQRPSFDFNNKSFKIIHFIFDKQLKESSVEEVVTDKDEIYLDLLVDCIDYHQSFFNQSQSTSKYSQKSVQVHVCWPWAKVSQHTYSYFDPNSVSSFIWYMYNVYLITILIYSIQFQLIW